MRLTQLIEVLNTQAVFEYNLMERFAQSDVANVSWFWAHPASGRIFHIPSDSSHTISALDPNGPIAVKPDEIDGENKVSVDDYRVFEVAFRRGWVRSMYIPDDDGSPLGSQVGLHGGDEETVRTTLKMLLDKGLQVDRIGMQGHYDDFEYDEPWEG